MLLCQVPRDLEAILTHVLRVCTPRLVLFLDTCSQGHPVFSSQPQERSAPVAGVQVIAGPEDVNVLLEAQTLS